MNPDNIKWIEIDTLPSEEKEYYVLIYGHLIKKYYLLFLEFKNGKFKESGFDPERAKITHWTPDKLYD